MERDFDIAKWIVTYLTTEMTEEECGKLEHWREESLENERLFEKIVDEANMRKKRLLYQKFDSSKGWGKVVERYNVRKRRKYYLHLVACAASIILPLLLVVFFVTEYTQPEKEEVTIAFETSKAKLVLPTGEEIDLDDTKGMILASHDETVHNEGTLVSYNSSNKADPTLEKPVYHRIVIPRGREYHLRLSDSTLIHLNAMSAVRFPVNFTGDKREVILENGEAYFEVAHNAAQPFVVHTTNYDIEVLGTAFNISSYADDAYTQTTLLSGSVKICGLSGDVALNPGEQLSYEITTGEYAVSHVNVDDVTAWKYGRLRFRDTHLEDIMRLIGRWYDIEVEYADNEVRHLHYGINVQRPETVDALLTMFEVNGKIEIERKGRLIKIMNK